MATSIFEETNVYLLDGTEIRIVPLKIFYLKKMMAEFGKLKNSSGEDETMDIILRCAKICMEQLYPQLSTVEQIADSMDMQTLYTILDYAAGISLDPNKDSSIEKQAEEEVSKKKDSQQGQSWDTLDLAKYESMAFLLGIWKNYDELEKSMSLKELTETLSTHNEVEHSNKKFFAAIQGIDLDGGKKNAEEDPWEAMKARVAAKTSGITPQNSNDITSFTGVKARQAGFGIGMGLDYEKVD